MLCENCKEQKATVHTQTNMNGHITESHLCSACAVEAGFDSKGSSFEIGIPSLLAQLLGWNGGRGTASVCPECNTGLEAIRSSGRVGCASCYGHFETQLAPFIERIHGGSAKHNGRVPKSAGEEINRRRKIISLEERLQNAVAAQEFEEAARLRDEIKSLKEAK